MYTSYIFGQIARDRHRELLTQAEHARRARQERQLSRASSQKASRYGRRGWQLALRLHARAQS